MDKKKAIAAGHICLDITPAFKSKEEKSIKDLFRPGQLIAMDAAKVSLGGSVSNTGIGMKRLVFMMSTEQNTRCRDNKGRSISPAPLRQSDDSGHYLPQESFRPTARLKTGFSAV